MMYLQLSIYVLLTLSMIYSLQIKMDENIEGVLNSTETKLQCAFEKGDDEEILSMILLVKNITTNNFIQIVRFRPDRPSILFPGGDYLSGRVILSNFTTSSLAATLTFTHLQCIDDNTYQCQVTYYNSGGEQTEQIASTNLSVKVIPSVPDIVWDYTSLSEGENISFICSGNVGNPPGKIIWQKMFSDLTSETYSDVSTILTTTPDSCSYNGTSNITIQMTDEDNNGVIRCSVNNSHGEVYFKDTQPLNVYFKARTQTITKFPMKNEYVEGSCPILLTCIGKGNPHPSYSWIKNGVMEDSVLSSKETYIITNVIANNSGEYRCFISNKIYNTEYTESIAVNIIIVKAESHVQTTSIPLKVANENGYATSISFSVIAVILLIALVSVVILCCRRNRELRLKLESNYVDLSRLGSPVEGNAAYAEIINSTVNVSKYEDLESNALADSHTGQRNYNANQRTDDGYEYPDSAERGVRI